MTDHDAIKSLKDLAADPYEITPLEALHMTMFIRKELKQALENPKKDGEIRLKIPSECLRAASVCILYKMSENTEILNARPNTKKFMESIASELEQTAGDFGDDESGHAVFIFNKKQGQLVCVTIAEGLHSIVEKKVGEIRRGEE